jgi:hypothetical protein
LEPTARLEAQTAAAVFGLMQRPRIQVVVRYQRPAMHAMVLGESHAYCAAAFGGTYAENYEHKAYNCHILSSGRKFKLFLST